jgi:hypothetical protein
MTVDEASKSGGIRLIRAGSGGIDEYECSYVQLKGEPKGIRFIVTKGRIARVDISSKRITTISGARIGDNENRILSLYRGQIKATPHPYVSRRTHKGKYLTFVPKDAANKNYRIIFETNKNRVDRFRSGKLPEVEYIEGCS